MTVAELHAAATPFALLAGPLLALAAVVYMTVRMNRERKPHGKPHGK